MHGRDGRDVLKNISKVAHSKTLPSWRCNEFLVLLTQNHRRSWNKQELLFTPCVWLWLDSPTHQNRMLLGINLPIPTSSIIYLPLQKSNPILSVSVVLQAALMSGCLRDVCVCFLCSVVVCVWGGWLHVVAVQTLSLPLRGVSVVALSSRHYRLVSLLACCARQPFCLPDENIVGSWRSDASCWSEKKINVPGIESLKKCSIFGSPPSI